MTKPLIIEALEDIGPCDVETLSGYMSQSEGMINSMLVNYMRKGLVRCVNPDAAQCIPRAYELTEKARLEYGCQSDDDTPLRAGVVAAGPAHSKASDTVVQHAVQQPVSSGPAEVKPVTTHAALPTITEIVTVSPVSKVEQLRRIMRADGGDMYVSELADESGIPVKNIPGLLQNDVRIGQVTLTKVDGKSVYRWCGGAAQPAKSDGDRQPQTRTGTGISANKGGVARQPLEETVTGEVSPKLEAPASTSTMQADQQEIVTPAPSATTAMSTLVDCITIPTSAALSQELYNLDSELISLTERLKTLRSDRDRKTQILLAVQKLEELLKGETA